MGWGRWVREEVRVTLARGWVLPPPNEKSGGPPLPPNSKVKGRQLREEVGRRAGEGESVPEVD